jgi:hypothetical protein
LLILFWEKISGQSPTAEILNLSLLDDSGQPVQNWTIPPVQSSYPPSDWQPGERLRGQHSLRLPAGLESGRYQFRLEDIDLRTITVNAPERLFEAPEIETAVNASFDDQIQLTGYTTGITDGTLSVSLIWQALSELSTSYRVFVHLVDENGRIIVQSDGEPANWSRPTTGWANGEYIIDPHTLTLPNGAIPPSSTLRVGLYDPITNTRLMVDNGDFLSLSP